MLILVLLFPCYVFLSVILLFFYGKPNQSWLKFFYLAKYRRLIVTLDIVHYSSTLQLRFDCSLVYGLHGPVCLSF